MIQNARLFFLKIEMSEDPAFYSTFLPALLQHIPVFRREKALRFRRDKDRLMSAAAAALLMYSLREAGCSEPEPAFVYNENEKPFLADRRLDFNLSHTEGAALCAVTQGGHTIGCDVELVSRPDMLIAKHCFCESEKDFLLSITDPEVRQQTLCRFWTLKESVVKAIGCGLSLPLKSFCISLDTDEIRVEAPGREALLFYREYPADPDVCCSCSALSRSDLPDQPEFLTLPALLQAL